MEPDVNDINVNSMALMFNGQEIGTMDNVSLSIGIDSPKDKIKDIPFEFNNEYECSFKLIGESKRRLFLWVHLNLKNSRLIKIFNKTKKLRTKKKLAGRINRNVYELIKLGFY